MLGQDTYLNFDPHHEILVILKAHDRGLCSTCLLPHWFFGSCSALDQNPSSMLSQINEYEVQNLMSN